MAKTKAGGFGTGNYVEAKPKKTRQGKSQNTKLSASSRNAKKKRYRGQGR
jgi:hypothetical protein